MKIPYLSDKLRLWFLFSAGFIMLFLFLAENRVLISNPNSSLATYGYSLRQGHGGMGRVGDYRNNISFTGLEPGDIIIGGYPDCGYGDYSHAALYIGDGLIIEGYADTGLSVQSLDHFRTYSKVALLNVLAPPEVKAQAVSYALAHCGEVFYPLAFKRGERVWNCSKIMWKAYKEQGIELDPLYDDIWVKPESFKDSPLVRVISEKNV